MARRKRFHPSKLRSKFEGLVEQQLKKAKVKYEYESIKIEWTRKISSGICLGCGNRSVGQRCTYTPDFVLGNGIILEVKGYLDGADRSKLRAIRSQHPGLDLRLVFQRDNPIPGTKNKTRYSEWAQKNGFKYCIGTIPKEWLKS